MTLLEMTVVILVLLSLIGILFIGARAWKRGADRAACIVNIRNVQHGVRGYANMYGYNPNTPVAGLKARVIGPNQFVEKDPECPSGGLYTFADENTVPDLGVLYAACPNIATLPDHIPGAYADW
ncbi:MAG: type II secretion system protein [Luteolibacter sp.]